MSQEARHPSRHQAGKLARRHQGRIENRGFRLVGARAEQSKTDALRYAGLLATRNGGRSRPRLRRRCVVAGRIGVRVLGRNAAV